MSIPVEPTGPKVKPLIDESADPVIDSLESDTKTTFYNKLSELMSEPKYVIKGERDGDRNKIEYPGHCNGTREKERRLARLQSKVYNEGC